MIILPLLLRSLPFFSFRTSIVDTLENERWMPSVLKRERERGRSLAATPAFDEKEERKTQRCFLTDGRKKNSPFLSPLPHSPAFQRFAVRSNAMAQELAKKSTYPSSCFNVLLMERPPCS